MEKRTLYGSKVEWMEWMKADKELNLPTKRKDFKAVLSDYFYEFITLNCGSDEHYDKAGWIGMYPTLEDLKRFFLHNEYGKRVIEYVPGWKTDVHKILDTIEIRLFPLRSYARYQKNSH
jgi:hypothetical protein